jgi:hypothetical protein
MLFAMLLFAALEGRILHPGDPDDVRPSRSPPGVPKTPAKRTGFFDRAVAARR